MASHVRSYKPGNCSIGPPDVLPAFDLDDPKYQDPPPHIKEEDKETFHASV